MDGHDLKTGPVEETDEIKANWDQLKQDLKDIYNWFILDAFK